MNRRAITVAGHAVEIAELGAGEPLVYLHGFADIHAASAAWLPFHEALAGSRKLIAPAAPGCAGSEEDELIETIDDAAFRAIEVLDALGLQSFDLAGTCFGGWLAAELAVRHPERVRRLALIGASGLFVPGHPIGDLFWEIQPVDGTRYGGLRKLLFAGDSDEAKAMFPDGRAALDIEISRYKAMRYCSRVGFSPPYFYNRKLEQRLARYRGPALLLWGEQDHMVPLAHARAYERGLQGAKAVTLAGAGHSVHIEKPREAAAALVDFFG